MSWYVGQQVYCLRYGVGKIANIDNSILYSIKVEFPDGRFNYTLGGKWSENDANPILYAEKPEITLPKWQPKPGEWCWFWDQNTHSVHLAKFSGIVNNKLYRSAEGVWWQNCAPFIGELPEHLKEVES
jgi:hypothetical protein